MSGNHQRSWWKYNQFKRSLVAIRIIVGSRRKGSLTYSQRMMVEAPSVNQSEQGTASFVESTGSLKERRVLGECLIRARAGSARDQFVRVNPQLKQDWGDILFITKEMWRIELPSVHSELEVFQLLLAAEHLWGSELASKLHQKRAGKYL